MRVSRGREVVVIHSEKEEEEDDGGVRTHVHYVLKAGEAGKALRCSFA